MGQEGEGKNKDGKDLNGRTPAVVGFECGREWQENGAGESGEDGNREQRFGAVMGKPAGDGDESWFVEGHAHGEAEPDPDQDVDELVVDA